MTWNGTSKWEPVRASSRKNGSEQCVSVHIITENVCNLGVACGGVVTVKLCEFSINITINNKIYYYY